MNLVIGIGNSPVGDPGDAKDALESISELCYLSGKSWSLHCDRSVVFDLTMGSDYYLLPHRESNKP